jgi:hypothetical protein
MFPERFKGNHPIMQLKIAISHKDFGLDNRVPYT